MNYEFIGWCKEGTADKVWIMVEISHGHFATIWGRRGKKLQTKEFGGGGGWEAQRLINAKCNKGYSPIQKDQLDVVYPEFEKDLEQTAMWAVLKG